MKLCRRVSGRKRKWESTRGFHNTCMEWKGISSIMPSSKELLINQSILSCFHRLTSRISYKQERGMRKAQGYATQEKTMGFADGHRAGLQDFRPNSIDEYSLSCTAESSCVMLDYGVNRPGVIRGACQQRTDRRLRISITTQILDAASQGATLYNDQSRSSSPLSPERILRPDEMRKHDVAPAHKHAETSCAVNDQPTARRKKENDAHGKHSSPPKQFG